MSQQCEKPGKHWRGWILAAGLCFCAMAAAQQPPAATAPPAQPDKITREQALQDVTFPCRQTRTHRALFVLERPYVPGKFSKLDDEVAVRGIAQCVNDVLKRTVPRH